MPSTAPRHDISVVTVTYNSADVIGQCLTSLAAQPADIRREVWIVDNASSDDTRSCVRATNPNATTIANDDNVGFACANNQAIARATGRYILLLNPDVQLATDTLRTVLDFAEAHPKAGAIGCRTVDDHGALQHTCFLPPSITNLLINMLRLQRLFPRSRFFGRERLTYWNQDDARQVPVIGGWFMFLRREALEAVGDLDERFFMYAEEVDWCVRCRRAGWEVWFTPDTTISHIGGASTPHDAYEKRRRIEKSVYLYLAKHRGALYATVYRALSAIYFAIRWPFRRFLH